MVQEHMKGGGDRGRGMGWWWWETHSRRTGLEVVAAWHAGGAPRRGGRALMRNGGCGGTGWGRAGWDDGTGQRCRRRVTLGPVGDQVPTSRRRSSPFRDPRWCPGALGYAMGEDPDLANMLLCLTFLDEGDFIFLTSDGVADNFDPVIRKMARHQVGRAGRGRAGPLTVWEAGARLPHHRCGYGVIVRMPGKVVPVWASCLVRDNWRGVTAPQGRLPSAAD